MKIEIETVDNGAILRFAGNDGSAECSCYPYQDEEQQDYMLYMLRDVVDCLFGEDTTRYSSKRIHISWMHGDKYECKEENCEICKEAKS